MNFKIDFDGAVVRYRFLYPWTHLQFGEGYLTATGEGPDIELSRELIRARRHIFDPHASEHFIEYRLLVEPTGTFLASRGRFFFHSVAFLWKGRAWLLTGPSGVGKTTQFLNWKRLWPEEVAVICGDMPLLSVRDGMVWVNPSPWNGSERYGEGTALSAPLGGVIDLEQAETDAMRPMDLGRKVRSVWHRFIGMPDTADDIRQRERFLNRMLDDVPFWTLENRGDEGSARLARKVMEGYLKGSEESHE